VWQYQFVFSFKQNWLLQPEQSLIYNQNNKIAVTINTNDSIALRCKNKYTILTICQRTFIRYSYHHTDRNTQLWTNLTQVHGNHAYSLASLCDFYVLERTSRSELCPFCKFKKEDASKRKRDQRSRREFILDWWNTAKGAFG
jgi:hypothetical protein